MLRRSKDMTICKTGLPLLGLKKLTVEFVPVPQRPSERALYCWMEYLISQELGQDGEAGDLTSRNLCLRLLRDLCVSTVSVYLMRSNVFLNVDHAYCLLSLLGVCF